MSNQEQKAEYQSLSSLSMEHNLRQFGVSHVFHNGARKSSFQFANILKDSAHFNQNELKNSLDFLGSNMVFEPKNFLQTREIFKYDEKQKKRLQQAGVKAIQIGQIESQSEADERLGVEKPSESYQQSYEMDLIMKEYKPTNYLPPDLEQILKDRGIPLEYVKGLLLVKDNADVKSVRRLKVERYLEKRRSKTWNRKICYNCRQKVAEERLRIKGKFIKKRRAMELLGLTKPIPMVQLKKLLEHELKDKTHAEIEQLIKRK